MAAVTRPSLAHLLLGCVIRITSLLPSTCESIAQFVFILEGYELGQHSSFVVAAHFQRLGVWRRVRNLYPLRSCRCLGFRGRGCCIALICFREFVAPQTAARSNHWARCVSNDVIRRQFRLSQIFGSALHHRREGRGCQIHLLFKAFMGRYGSAHRHT